jgi:hypothetical protein
MGLLTLGAVALAATTALAIPAATASVSPGTSKSSSPPAGTSPTPPAPLGVNVSPVLTQVSPQQWTTVIFLNTSALCPAPTFFLVTTSPDYKVPGTPNPLPCAASASATSPALLTQVTLTFGPKDLFSTPPVSAAVVIVPGQPTSPPVQIQVAVHRLVTSLQYLWIPLSCGLGLAVLLIAVMLALGLPDPDKPGNTLRRTKLLVRPVYAPSAWSFTGSWATNITTAGAVVSTLLGATGSVSDLLPGVELARFSLLAALAGGITLAAPLVLGALNYRFARIDPSTSGVSVLSLPTGPVVVLSGWLQNTLRGQPKRRYSGAVVVATDGPAALSRTPGRQIQAGHWMPVRAGVRVKPLALPRAKTLGDDGYITLPGHYRAIVPDAGEPPRAAVIAVPAGATMNVAKATLPLPYDGVQPICDVTIDIPPGSMITVTATDRVAGMPALALPGGNDIAVFAGQKLTISQSAAAKPGTNAGPDPLPASHPVKLAGSAKITFLGRAILTLPAGTTVAAEVDPDNPAKNSALRRTTVFRLPHTTEVVDAAMWVLLVAASLTIIGAGAELGILGVLTFSLTQAASWVRNACLVGTAILGALVLCYTVVSIRSLADPAPGDSLNGSGGASFLP